MNGLWRAILRIWKDYQVLWSDIVRVIYINKLNRVLSCRESWMRTGFAMNELSIMVRIMDALDIGLYGSKCMR